MKRILSLILALVMVFSMVPPSAVQARTTAETPHNMAFSEDTSFGKLLNTAITEETASASELESHIHSLTVSGKTASVNLTVPMDALLVVGIYDETEDTLLGSGTLEVTAGEEAQSVSVSIEINEMPTYFRGKAFLLDRTSFAPMSQVCQYEYSTKGYQDILNAKATDFSEELVYQFEENNINTNFAVFQKDVLRSDAARITPGSNGTYTITNANAKEKAMKPGDVITAILPDGSFLIIKAASVSVQGNTLVITESDDLEALEVFQMIKLDINSTDYGIADARDKGIAPLSSTEDDVRVHLLSEDDPLNTSEWEVKPEGILNFKPNGAKDNLPFELKIKPVVVTQYYLTDSYSFYSAKMNLEIKTEIDMGKIAEFEGKEKTLVEEWGPVLEVPTGTAGLNVLALMKIGIEFKPEAKISGTITSSIGMEYYSGSGVFHNISTPMSISAGAEVSAGAILSVSAGVGIGVIHHKLLNLAIKGKAELSVKAVREVTTDTTEKLHACVTCNSVKLGFKMVVVGGIQFVEDLDFLSIFQPKLELPLEEKEVGLFHFCQQHDHLPYPYDPETITLAHADWLKCPYTAWKVTMEVVDENGSPLVNTPVSLRHSSGESPVKMYSPSALTKFEYLTELVTDEFGRVEVYLLNGTYDATVGGSTSSFAVTDQARTVTITGSKEDQPVPETEWLEIFMDSRVPLNGSIYPVVVMTDGRNSRDVTELVTWTSDKPAIGTVDSTGRDTFHAFEEEGTVTLQANYEENGKIYADNHQVRIYKIIDSGTAGNLNWSYGSDYVLAISGEGRMTSNPWRNYNPRAERIIVGEGITYIMPNAFENCAVATKIELPETLTEIGSEAMINCESLEYLFIPKNVEKVAGDVWENCPKLTDVEVHPENPYIGMVDGMLISVDGQTLMSIPFLKSTTLHIPDGVAFIADNACTGKPIVKLELPHSLLNIGESAFENCALLQSITVYDSGYTIGPNYNYNYGLGYRAFKNCTALTKVEFPSGMTYMNNEVFRGCTALASIVIPDQFMRVGDYTFADCTSLTNIKLPSELKRYPNGFNTSGIFYNCTSLTEITIPEGIQYIPYACFMGCESLYDVDLPSSIVDIGNSAFEGCESLSGLELPAGVTRIGGMAFKDTTSLTELTLPESLKIIAISAFENSAIEYMDIPDSVTSLDMSVFRNCKNLSEVSVGKGVKALWQCLFEGSGLQVLYIRGLLDSMATTTFKDCEDMSTIYYAGRADHWAAIELVYLFSTDVPVFEDFLAGLSIHFDYIDSRYLDEASLDPEAPANEEKTSETPYQEDNTSDIPDQENNTSETPDQEDNTSDIPDQENNTSEAPDQEDSTSDIPDQENNTPDTPNQEDSTSEAPDQEDPADVSGEEIVADSLAVKQSWYHLDLLSSTGKVTEDGGAISVSYSDLAPGRQYLLLMLQDQSSYLVPENLLYINQLTAQADGTITHRFIPRVTGTDSQPVLIVAAVPGYQVSGVEDADSYGAFYVDGKPIYSLSGGIPFKDGALLTGYKFAASGSETQVPAEFTRYPTSMDVWKLTFREDTGTYQAQLIPEMHNLFQYDGCSIRIVGVKGIRMLTSIGSNARQQLIKDNIAGYTLEEYGTVVCWESNLISGGGSLTLDDSYALANSAYSRTKGQDAIFATVKDRTDGSSRIQYTNVLVNFTMDQCRDALCMRPYMILKDADGNQVILYGGIVTRSIGYIALQNADVFSKGSAAYTYVHSIIQHCYPTV